MLLVDGPLVMEWLAGDGVGVPLVGLAHGSRHPNGAAAIERLMSASAALRGIEAEAAFLDLAPPDLESVARRLASEGHQSAVVVPLLFTAAFHATVDVPEAVQAASAAVGIELLVADILGTGADIADLLRTAMARAGIGDGESVLLFAVGSSNPAANQAVADLADRLAASRSGVVRSAFGTTEPRAASVLAQLPEPIAIVPLFLSAGLLLDPLLAMAADRGWAVSAPLGELAAPVVLQRYDSARRAAHLG